MAFLPTLYNTDSSGSIRSWKIEVDGDKYRSYAGLLEGKQAVSGWTVCTPKNIGTKIETTSARQAAVEAEAEYTKKRSQGWTEDVNQAGKLKPFAPMLAHTFDRDKHQLFASDSLFSQPKLDGVRCIATRQGLFSRKWKPLLSTPHIFSALQPIFEDHPSLIIDGELYTHRLSDNFNEIISLVKKSKPKADDLLKSEEFVEFHAFDIVDERSVINPGFGSRHQQLRGILDRYAPRSVVEVPTATVGDYNQLDELMASYISDGYEGQMIRFNEPYENKRSRTLLKRKEFKDDEFAIVRIEEGNGNWLGCAKRVVLSLPDGREFEASMRGSQDFAKQLLKDANTYIGRPATVRFQEYTPDGVPRFGVVTEFGRDDH